MTGQWILTRFVFEVGLAGPGKGGKFPGRRGHTPLPPKLFVAPQNVADLSTFNAFTTT